MDRFARQFGTNVRQMRVGRGMTQAQLATVANVGANYVPRLERGEMMPSVETAHRIAQALGTTVDALCGSIQKRDILREAARTLVAMTDDELAAFKRAVRAVEELRDRLRAPRRAAPRRKQTAKPRDAGSL